MKIKEKTFIFEPQLCIEEAVISIYQDGIYLMDFLIEFCIKPEKQKKFILKLKNFLGTKCKLEYFQAGHLIKHQADNLGIIHSYPNLWGLRIKFTIKTTLSMDKVIGKIENLMKKR